MSQPICLIKMFPQWSWRVLSLAPLFATICLGLAATPIYAAPQDPIAVSILSWNLHGLPWPMSRDPGARMEQVAAKIRELSPEIVTLQEVWRDSEVERLVNALQPEWTPLYSIRALGAPRGGLVAMVRRSDGCRIPDAPDFERFHDSASAWKVWQGDGLGRKGLLTFQIQCAHSTISVIDTHLQSQYPGVDYHTIRRAQIEQLESVASHFDHNSFVLIAGDFNTDAREPLYSEILQLGSDLTATTRLHCDCGTTYTDSGPAPEWIDYILARPPANWSATGTMSIVPNRATDDPYSDHSGLFSTVTFTPSPTR
jgi:endonuclease/exonuclease/phosphatase family metal-dependent hydrolase